MNDTVLIVGGGLAAQRAAETLRRRGHGGTIGMLCAEAHAPYDRPPLSKELLAGHGGHAQVALRPADWHDAHDVRLLRGEAAVALDPATRQVVTASGGRLDAQHVLIATGSEPRPLPLLDGYANVHTLRTLDDAAALRAAIAPGTRLAIVGAGFIGQEVAATARGAGAHATLIEALPVPLMRLLGPRLGAWFAGLHREHGVDVALGVSVAAGRGDDRVEALELADGRRVPCDAVLVGVGVAPATGWLSGTPLGGGPISVDALGRTALPGVYAAGDVAATPSPGGGHERCEHWEAAVRGAVAAAHGILRLDPPPAAVPGFWSDQYGLRIQLVGRPAGADALDLDGDLGSRSFVARFLRRGRPVAALLVDRPAELAHHRRLIQAGTDTDSEREAA
jgi:NADPH-dependent 2,4-dienoyl-CoA reductase/sulfur reductase-like enzyme